MNGIKVFLTILLASASSMSMALDLPKPPNGFSWAEAEEIKGAFLKPNGWYFKKAKKGDTQGYFITKENINESGNFLTGTTINVAPDIPRKTGKTPTEFAYSYIMEASRSIDIVKRPWNHRMGPFNSYGVVLHNKDRKSGDYVTHHLVIANDQTGTVYLVIFESPAATWEHAWSTGEQILGKLYIDSDV